MKRPASAAIIGAGLAGLSAAATLHRAGVPVCVFDKGRGLGGRAATRRLGDRPCFDHGLPWIPWPLAQALPSLPLSAGQAPVLHRLGEASPGQAPTLPQDAGVGAPTTPLDALGISSEDRSRFWHLPPDHRPSCWPEPGISALPKALAQGVTVHLSHTVTGAMPAAEGWMITATPAPDQPLQQFGPFAILILALPAPQALALISADSALGLALAQVVYAPCWTLMVDLADPPPAGFGVLQGAAEDADRRWLIQKEGQKPGRPAGAITVQADGDWTRRHLEHDREDVIALLRAYAADRVPDPAMARWVREAPAAYAAAHRWRYSRCLRPAVGPGRSWLADAGLGLYAIGDSVTGPSAARAALSGTALARHLLNAG